MTQYPGSVWRPAKTHITCRTLHKALCNCWLHLQVFPAQTATDQNTCTHTHTSSCTNTNYNWRVRIQKQSWSKEEWKKDFSNYTKQYLTQCVCVCCLPGQGSQHNLMNWERPWSAIQSWEYGPLPHSHPLPSHSSSVCFDLSGTSHVFPPTSASHTAHPLA